MNLPQDRLDEDLSSKRSLAYSTNSDIQKRSQYAQSMHSNGHNINGNHANITRNNSGLYSPLPSENFDYSNISKVNRIEKCIINCN